MNVSDLPNQWWGKAALAGVIGAVVFGLYEMLVSWAVGGSFWGPMNMVGATFAVYRPVAPDFTAASLVGVGLHVVTGAVWGLVYGALAAAFFPRALFDRGPSVIAGLLYGVVVYLVMGLFIGPLVDPALQSANAINYFIGHMLYGLATALSLAAMTSRREVDITYEPATVAERERVDR